MPETRKPFMAEIQAARRSQQMPFARSVPGATDVHPGAADLPALAAPAAPVAVDNSEVLRAIAEVGAKLDRFLTNDQVEIDRIQVEINDIAGRIRATKAEMAALRHPLADEDRFRLASEELSAVVAATEAATNTIMSSAELVEDLVNQLKARTKSADALGKYNDISDILVKIYEACNFQDLTGQRINKVVQTLTFIEERVEAMMSVWNKREFETMPLPPSLTKKDGELELHGPVAASESISQDEIDKLFG
ncbi:MAG TPA: protein phosphatase CheZ [Azospirillaceae bacterium]|nr:protein phosphatase CheZ [Azospirillaceae bacterium]